jgi:uncharacterized protein (DUF1501 family)
MSDIQSSRRRFLKQGGILSIAGTVSAPWLLNLAAVAEASAATTTTSDYKALVCVFLEGGNDASNTILPAVSDTLSWKRYLAARQNTHIKFSTALPQLSTTTSNGTLVYPVNENLRAIQSLYSQGKLAVVANVGNIAGATNRDSIANGTATVPPRLRSHNDQQTVWQSGRSNVESMGWGGRYVQPYVFKDVPSSDPRNNFRSVVFGNSNVFNMGESITAYGMVRQAGVIELLGKAKKVYGSLAVDTVVKQVITGAFKTPRTNLIEKDYAAVVSRALQSVDYIKGTVLTQPAVAAIDTTQVPSAYNEYGSATGTSELGLDLQMVAKVIKGHQALGNGRQVFFVTLRGFDTHSGSGKHSALLREVAESLAYFNAVLGDEVSKSVVTFTASDFGRLLHENGDGWDHGWGGHQFVMGGGIKGSQIYGDIPSYERDAITDEYVDPQIMDDGALIPKISIQSYAATLGKWFVNDDALLTSTFGSLPANWNLGMFA